MKETVIDCSGLDLSSYDRFLGAKLSPFYSVRGRVVKVNEDLITLQELNNIQENEGHLFDYQKFILNLAVKKRKFAVWADCGLGKTAFITTWTEVFRSRVKKRVF